MVLNGNKMIVFAGYGAGGNFFNDMFELELAAKELNQTPAEDNNTNNNNNLMPHRISPQSSREKTSPQISPQNNNKTVITLSNSSLDESNSQLDCSQPLTSISPPKPNPPMQAAAPGSSQFKCPVCLEMCKEPHAARCGHICGYACWAQCLETKLECPVCRERLRLKQLTKLFV